MKTVGILGRKKSFQGSNKVRKDLRRERNLKVKKKRFRTTVPQGTGGEEAHRRQITENKTMGKEDINSLIRNWKQEKH